jgi:catechol 2,3-dioxygenase-like lactoylglutathione lyase family enzyme
VIDHMSVQVSDVDASTRFYVEVFGPLGLSEVMRYPVDGGQVVGLAGPDGFPHFWLGPMRGSSSSELHVAFNALDRAAVDAVHEAAVIRGVEVLHPPQVWPEYHEAYYGVFLRDPDGHNVEAVCHRPPT